MNSPSQMVARIRKVLPTVTNQNDREALNYIFLQLQPGGLDARTEGHESVSHLIWTANDRLRKYEGGTA